jgi:hypothetical protein
MHHGKHTYVCVRDRRVSRAGWGGTGSWMCPVCRQPMQHLGYRWRAPKRDDNAAWARIEAGEWLWDRRAIRRRTFRPDVPKYGIPWFERAPRDSRGRPAKHRPRRGVADR